jgi:ankyrin repeat protein
MEYTIQDARNKHLFKAIYHGDIDLARNALVNEADVNGVIRYKGYWSSPLRTAVKYNRIEMIKFLVSRGAIASDWDEITGLFKICVHRDDVYMFTVLLGQGVLGESVEGPLSIRQNIENWLYVIRGGSAPMLRVGLEDARMNGTLNQFLNKPVTVPSTIHNTPYGLPLLHYAVGAECLYPTEMAQLLIEFGASVFDKDASGRIALDIARISHDEDGPIHDEDGPIITMLRTEAVRCEVCFLFALGNHGRMDPELIRMVVDMVSGHGDHMPYNP